MKILANCLESNWYYLGLNFAFDYVEKLKISFLPMLLMLNEKCTFNFFMFDLPTVSYRFLKGSLTLSKITRSKTTKISV